MIRFSSARKSISSFGRVARAPYKVPRITDARHNATATGALVQTKKRRRWPYVFLGLGAASYSTYVYLTNDPFLRGPLRGIWFWYRVGPLVARYFYLHKFGPQDGPESEKAWADLNESGAEIAQTVILDLRGFYVKVRNISTRFAISVGAESS